MGTTRIKVIDLSGEKEQIKTSRKHAEKLTGVAKIKAAGPVSTLTRREEKKTKSVTTEGTEDKLKTQRESTIDTTSVPSDLSSDLSAKALASAEALAKEELSKPSVPSEPKSVVARKKKRHLGKKYAQAKGQLDSGKVYPAKDAIELLTKTSITKFDPTVE